MEPVLTPGVETALRSTTDLILGFASDFIAFIVVAALAAAFAFYFGRDRLVPLIAGLITAIPLYSYFPFLGILGANPLVNIGIYAAFAFAGLVAFSGLSGWIPSQSTGFLSMFGLSAIAGGIVLAVTINILPVADLYTFSEPARALFASQYFFWWLVAGIGGVFILSKS